MISFVSCLIWILDLSFLKVNQLHLSPEGNYESSIQEGPLDSLSISYVIDEPKLGPQKYTTISDFLKISKTFVRMGGWMGGWVGGDQNGTSIFLIFKYINKQTVLIPNMVLKVVYGFYIRSYEHFKFQN